MIKHTESDSGGEVTSMAVSVNLLATSAALATKQACRSGSELRSAAPYLGPYFG